MTREEDCPHATHRQELLRLTRHTDIQRPKLRDFPARRAGTARTRPRQPVAIPRCASCWKTCCGRKMTSLSAPRTSRPCPNGSPPVRAAGLPLHARASAAAGISPASPRWPISLPPCATPWRAARAAIPKKINPLLPAELVIDHSRAGGAVRHRHRLGVQRRDRISAQRGALPVPALGAEGLPEFRSGAAGYGDLPPGEPGISGPGGLRHLARRPRRRLSRFAGGHRLAHHHDQRAGSAGLGRRRNRGRRPQCSGNRFPCWCPTWSASNCTAGCPKGLRLRTWS